MSMKEEVTILDDVLPQPRNETMYSSEDTFSAPEAEAHNGKGINCKQERMDQESDDEGTDEADFSSTENDLGEEGNLNNIVRLKKETIEQMEYESNEYKKNRSKVKKKDEQNIENGEMVAEIISTGNTRPKRTIKSRFTIVKKTNRPRKKVVENEDTATSSKMSTNTMALLEAIKSVDFMDSAKDSSLIPSPIKRPGRKQKRKRRFSRVKDTSKNGIKPKDLESPEGIHSNLSNTNIDNVGKDIAPFHMDEVMKQIKLTITTMTRPELEKFCLLKIQEEISTRTYRHQLVTKIKSLTNTLETYQKEKDTANKSYTDAAVQVAMPAYNPRLLTLLPQTEPRPIASEPQKDTDFILPDDPPPLINVNINKPPESNATYPCIRVRDFNDPATKKVIIKIPPNVDPKTFLANSAAAIQSQFSQPVFKLLSKLSIPNQNLDTSKVQGQNICTLPVSSASVSQSMIKSTVTFNSKPIDSNKETNIKSSNQDSLQDYNTANLNENEKISETIDLAEVEDNQENVTGNADGSQQEQEIISDPAVSSILSSQQPGNFSPVILSTESLSHEKSNILEHIQQTQNENLPVFSPDSIFANLNKSISQKGNSSISDTVLKQIADKIYESQPHMIGKPCAAYVLNQIPDGKGNQHIIVAVEAQNKNRLTSTPKIPKGPSNVKHVNIAPKLPSLNQNLPVDHFKRQFLKVFNKVSPGSDNTKTDSNQEETEMLGDLVDPLLTDDPPVNSLETNTNVSISTSPPVVLSTSQKTATSPHIIYKTSPIQVSLPASNVVSTIATKSPFKLKTVSASTLVPSPSTNINSQSIKGNSPSLQNDTSTKQIAPTIIKNIIMSRKLPFNTSTPITSSSSSPKVHIPDRITLTRKSQSSLSYKQINLVNTKPKVLMNSKQLVSLANEQIGSLASKQKGPLASKQIGSLASKQTGSLASKQIGSLASKQIGSSTKIGKKLAMVKPKTSLSSKPSTSLSDDVVIIDPQPMQKQSSVTINPTKNDTPKAIQIKKSSTEKRSASLVFDLTLDEEPPNKQTKLPTQKENIVEDFKTRLTNQFQQLLHPTDGENESNPNSKLDRKQKKVTCTKINISSLKSFVEGNNEKKQSVLLKAVTDVVMKKIAIHKSNPSMAKPRRIIIKKSDLLSSTLQVESNNSTQVTDATEVNIDISNDLTEEPQK